MAEQNSKSSYREQLHERIVDTAMRAFAAQGIRAVKMDDIAQQLSISKRTMYELYENKEELLYEGIRKYRERQRLDLQAFMQNRPNVIEIIVHEYRKKVRELNDTVPQFYDDLEKYPRVMTLLEKDREENRDRLRAFMRHGVDEGYFRSDIDYDMVVLLLDTIGYHIMSQRLYVKYSIEQIFHQVVTVYIRGLCTQLGVKLLDNLLASEKQPTVRQS